MALIYGLLLAFMLPAALGRFLDTGELGAAFKVKEVFALVKAAPVPFLIAIAGSMIAGFIAPIGGIAFGIGAIFTTAYAMAIIGHFYGSGLQRSQNQRGKLFTNIIKKATCVGWLSSFKVNHQPYSRIVLLPKLLHMVDFHTQLLLSPQVAGCAHLVT